MKYEEIITIRGTVADGELFLPNPPNWVRVVDARWPSKCKWSVKQTPNRWYSCAHPDEGLAGDSFCGIAPETAWTQCNTCKHFKPKGE